MFKFLKRLSGGDRAEPTRAETAMEYKGYVIVPAPRQESGGWTTEATITRDTDGETRTHRFIRADRSTSRESALELTLSKCRQTIDQLGEQIFH